MPSKKRIIQKPIELEKARTGIVGLDEITFGGLPKGRPTLICGSTGCGKTLMALEILIRGAVEFNEPGLFVAFEEQKDDIIKNIASLGFDVEELERKKLFTIDYVETKGFQLSGDYDLEGLFIRIDAGIKKINAKRVVVDTIDVLFATFQNDFILRQELRRLFEWFKERNLTVLITGEKGSGNSLTRHGIEEYVVDCVINLTHSIAADLYIRRLQIVKYRGSYHETSLFPFIITRKGISLLPITSLEMEFVSSTKRISTGIPMLDNIIGGRGYFENSAILISGSAGTGKTTFAGAFAKSLLNEKQKCLFISYEETESSILRNLASVGIDLSDAVKKGYFKISSMRPTHWGLERHLAYLIEEIESFKPNGVIIDPMSALSHCGSETEVYSILTRMIDFLKNKSITFLMTMQCFKGKSEEFTYGISSAIDTWIILRNEESGRELNPELLVAKSRGSKHSNQVWEFSITSSGIVTKIPYYGESGILSGTARIIEEGKGLIDKANDLSTLHQLNEQIALKKKLLEFQISGLNAEVMSNEFSTKEEIKNLKYKDHIHTNIAKDLKEVRSMNEAAPSSKRKKK